jgi:predicted RNase H-like nuclease
MGDTPNVVGIDGCRGGWVVASADGVRVHRELTLLGFDLVGIDMPIGLIDGPPRACDVEARRYLRPRGSSVFPAPPRAALRCSDYRAALAIARDATGRGISKQTFNIMPKIAELDSLIDESTRLRVIEVHPECAFRALSAGEVLPSKKTASGQALRQRLLADHFDLPSRVPPGAALDDMLDAYAVLWSTNRFLRGEHIVFGDGQRDARGLEMRIVC